MIIAKEINLNGGLTLEKYKQLQNGEFQKLLVNPDIMHHTQSTKFILKNFIKDCQFIELDHLNFSTINTNVYVYQTIMNNVVMIQTIQEKIQERLFVFSEINMFVNVNNILKFVTEIENFESLLKFFNISKLGILASQVILFDGDANKFSIDDYIEIQSNAIKNNKLVKIFENIKTKFVSQITYEINKKKIFFVVKFPNNVILSQTISVNLETNTVLFGDIHLNVINKEYYFLSKESEIIKILSH